MTASETFHARVTDRTSRPPTVHDVAYQVIYDDDVITRRMVGDALHNRNRRCVRGPVTVRIITAKPLGTPQQGVTND